MLGAERAKSTEPNKEALVAHTYHIKGGVPPSRRGAIKIKSPEKRGVIRNSRAESGLRWLQDRVARQVCPHAGETRRRLDECISLLGLERSFLLDHPNAQDTEDVRSELQNGHCTRLKMFI